MSNARRPTPTAQPEPLQAGREAFARHAWLEAFERLSEADRERPLGAMDLESLALAAFFAARADAELDIKERAFKAHEADGNLVRAAYLAIDVARTYGFRGKPSIASAWRRRAEQLIGADGDTYAHGYLALVGSEIAAGSGDLDAALALAERAVTIGATTADPDLRAYSQTNLGSLKIATGATTEGFALLEEASIAAVNGELSPFTSGVTACRMIRRLPGPHRLPAGERVDRGDREVLRSAVARGLPRRVSDPSRRGRRGRRGVEPGGAGARAGHERADGLQRDAAPGRWLLRDR